MTWWMYLIGYLVTVYVAFWLENAVNGIDNKSWFPCLALPLLWPACLPLMLVFVFMEITERARSDEDWWITSRVKRHFGKGEEE
jgi:uncharacterized membrane protein YhdT